MQTDQEHSDSSSSAPAYDGNCEHANYANQIELKFIAIYIHQGDCLEEPQPGLKNLKAINR